MEQGVAGHILGHALAGHVAEECPHLRSELGGDGLGHVPIRAVAALVAEGLRR
jgi:hypothetical protein